MPRQLHLSVAGAALALAALSVTLPGRLIAQAADDDRLPGPVLLRRIAEAVDGDRSGSQVYVVASYDEGLSYIGTFHDRGEAERKRRDLGTEAGIFGPYRTLAGSMPPFATCVHLRGSVMRVSCIPPARSLTPGEVSGMTLVIQRVDGTRDSMAIPGDADAIFLGGAAVDKFVLPYYLPILGLEGTTDLWRDLKRPRRAPR